MSTKVLFRTDKYNFDEWEVADSICNTIRYRTHVQPGDLIVPRYQCGSIWDYNELCADVRNMGGRMIHEGDHHKWIANFHWYEELKSWTFTSWTDENFYRAPDGPFVVKGKTNSCKLNWNTKMFAENKREAARISSELMTYPHIAQQGIVYRRYIPLRKYETGMNDLPFTDEWRFFYLRDKLLTYGYYWDIADSIPMYCDDCIIDFAQQIAKLIAKNKRTHFFVLDIAMKEDGNPILVEINDGAMSGLSCCSAQSLYSGLKKYAR